MVVPLLIVAAIVFGVVTPPELVGAAGAASLGVGAVSLAVALPARARWIAVVAALAMFGVAMGARARDTVLEAPLVARLGPLLDDRSAPPVWVAGRIAADASVSRPGESDAGESVLVAVDVTRVRIADAWESTSGRAMLSVGGATAATAASEWTRGREIIAPVLVRRPQVWRNFGAASERWQRLGQNADIGGSVKSAMLVDVRRGSALAEAGAAVRRRVRRDVMQIAGAISPETAAVVIAILIGDRSQLDRRETTALQRAGTYHVIAISGGNIAILVVACLVALRFVMRSRRLIALITIAVVVAYGAMVGEQASVERAVVAAVIVLGLQMAGWCVPSWRVLVQAAMVILLIDPLMAIDAGAWLSFGATLGILLFAGPMVAALMSRAGPRGTTPRTGVVRTVISAAVTLLAATIAAEVALMPISAAIFSQVSLAGLALNFIAIPAMAVAQFAGMAIVAFAHVAPPVALAAAHVGHWAVLAILRSADVVEFTPALVWQTPPVWAGWTIAYYASLGLTRVPRCRRAALAATVACGLVIAASPLWPRAGGPPLGWLRVTLLDVGQGDGILAQFPTGQSLLVDAGGNSTGFDVGSRVVRPALWALGVRRLEWLAVTHGDLDHAGGAPSLLDGFRPREVWEGVPVASNAVMTRMRRAAQDRSIAWVRLAAGENFEIGSAALSVVSPPVPDWERRVTRNDDSLVLRVVFGDVSLLLTGDISAAVEDTLPLASFRVPGQPRLRLLKAPHHGSRTSSSEALIRGWLPQAVFVSVGRGNTFGHPAPEVLERYRRAGIDVFRTDRDGAISIETDGRVVLVRTATGRTWRLSAVGS